MNPDHPVIIASKKLKESGITLNQVSIGPLTEAEVVDLVATSLCCSHNEAAPLGRLIHTKTQGNLFFTLHFLKGLYHKSLLWFNWDINKWCWDNDHIKWMEDTDNVIDFLVSSLKRVPSYVATVLHPAACIGHTFNMDIIRALPSLRNTQPSQLDHALQIALHQGFIAHAHSTNVLPELPEGQNDKFFSFTHDRVQQAVYNLFPSEPMHLEIGRVLLAQVVQQTPGSNPDDPASFKILNENELFTAMDHINHAADVIASSEFNNFERQRICMLNLHAGNLAKSSGAHESALKYVNCGIALLPADCWTGSLYPVALELHLLSAECEYMCGNAEWATEVFELILHFARTDLDKAAAFSLRMAVCTADAHFDEAIEAGCRACKLLGWDVEPTGAPMVALQMLTEVDKLLNNLTKAATSPPTSPVPNTPVVPSKTEPTVVFPASTSEEFGEGLGAMWGVSKLVHFPEMTDVKSIELMKVLSVMSSFTFLTNPAVFAMCACKMVSTLR